MIEDFTGGCRKVEYTNWSITMSEIAGGMFQYLRLTGEGLEPFLIATDNCSSWTEKHTVNEIGPLYHHRLSFYWYRGGATDSADIAMSFYSNIPYPIETLPLLNNHIEAVEYSTFRSGSGTDHNPDEYEDKTIIQAYIQENYMRYQYLINGIDLHKSESLSNPSDLNLYDVVSKVELEEFK